jgi:autotransporter-associated beta strand protein
MLPLAAGAAVTLGSLASSALGQGTWIGPTGTFTSATKWQGNTAPSQGTLAAPVNLNFTSGMGAAITATDNFDGLWVSNSLTLNVNNTFTVSCGANTIQLVGTAPLLSVNGVGPATISGITGNALQLAADSFLSGTGPGNITVSGGIIESGSHSLTIPGGNLRDLRVLYLGAGGFGSSFSGGLILDGGTVGAAGSNAAAFGAAGSSLTVTPNGGTIAINVNGGVNSSLGTLHLNGDLHVIGRDSLGLGVTGGTSVALEGASNVTLYSQAAGGVNPGAITVQGNSGSGAASPFAGAVVCDLSELPQFTTTAAGNLTLSAVAGQNTIPNGSLNQAASFDVRAGASLQLNNAVSDSKQNGDRIGDNTPVRLRSAKFELDAPAPAATSGHNYVPTDLTERIGVLSSAGNSAVSVSVFASSSSTRTDITTLQADSLARVERGTFTFSGSYTQTTGLSTLGDGSTAFRGRVILTNPLSSTEFRGGNGPAGSSNISILPYAEGDIHTGDPGSSLVTYGADGFRLLRTNEYYSTDVAPSDATANVRITSAVTNNASTTMNALVLGSGGTDGSVAGTGTLNITSGVIMAANGHGITSISNNVAFGNAEGIIYTPGAAGTGAHGLMITGQLTGTNGLTKSSDNFSGANNVLYLSADNSGLHGQLTLDGGVVQYSAANALPGDNTIVANGSNAINSGNAVGLWYAGAGATTLNRPVAVNTGTMTFRLFDGTLDPSTQGNLGNLTVAGQISGVGNVNYQPQTVNGNTSTPGEIYVTNTANSYTGVTRFVGGNTHIYADGSTGNGGAWNLGFGNIVLEGDVTNSRVVNISDLGTIDTHGFNLTLNGPVTGYGEGTAGLNINTTAGLTKNGEGTLTLNSVANNFAGAVVVNAGTLIINGNLGTSATNAVTVHYGATLGGSGTIYRAVTVDGGTVTPGNSPGILTIWGALNLAPSGTPATLRMELNGPVAGTGYDQVRLMATNTASTTTLQLGGDTPSTLPTNLQLHLGYAPASGSRFWLITNTDRYLANLGAADTMTGTFAGLPEGATVTLGTYGGMTFTGTISYTGDYDTNNPTAGTGNDVVIYNVRGGCGSADFNCDGDTGTDADIESFFACLAGTCPPPPCTSTADFNGDGDVGTDSDIEAFFRVLAGGTC